VVVEEHFLSSKTSQKANWALDFKEIMLISIFPMLYLNIFRENFTNLNLTLGYILMGHFVDNLIFPKPKKELIDNNWCGHEQHATNGFTLKSFFRYLKSLSLLRL